MKDMTSKVDGFGKPIDEAETYVVQDARSVVGNCALWWAKDHCGYTCELDRAHIFTGWEVKDRVSEIGTAMSGASFIAWPWTFANKHAIKHVRIERLREGSS